MKLTDRQQLIVDAKDRDVLVSAAAGSGKTATMVEAVIDRVTDREEPIDIDKILMVTFSNLAASQMKDKIRKRLEELLGAQPESEHLARQMILVNRADISTIDKFCKKVVTENYDKAGIDAGFDIAEQPVVSIMQNETLDKIFEQKYAELINENENKDNNHKYADFGMLRNYLCKDNRDDEELKNAVINLYRTAMKQPYPVRWLKKAIVATNVKSGEKLDKQPWMRQLLEYQRHMNESVLADIEATRSIYASQPGSEYFNEILEADIERIQDINAQSSYALMKEAESARWKVFSAALKKKIIAAGCPEDVVEEFSDKRDAYKKLFKSGFELNSTVDEILAAYAGYRKYYIPLIQLTLEFKREYDSLKKKRKLFEFHDVSHMAYDLLCEKNYRNEIIPTGLARQYSKKYRYIFIDEYQDGDYIQEGILTSISDGHNMCMVGDVKQSIYGFRNARPEIFLGKYYTYKECESLSDSDISDDDKQIKILLNQNFRSRKNVLDAANFFFWQLMDKSLGGLDYGEDTMLVEGCPHPESPSQLKTEILVAKSYDDEGNVSKYSKEDLETTMIVEKIKEILGDENPMMVLKEDYQDENVTEKYRRAVPGDIAILLRSVKKMGDRLYNALTAAGIPVNIDNSEGYYEAVELRIIMSLLEVIDNRYQDIPLEAVLVSPIAGLDENEMALVVKYGKNGIDENARADRRTLYEKCDMFLALFEQADWSVYKHSSLKLKGMLASAYTKLDSFFDFLDRYKRLSRELTVSELIWRALDESGYYRYAGAMPDGTRRCANLDKLMDMAKGFENGSYKGLFRFIRYMKQIEIENIDVGEVTAGKNENSVKVMTLHKSKGLEFPIVFVSNLCRQLGGGDKDKIRLDNDYYITGRYIDDVNRYLIDNTCQSGIVTLVRARECAEEMRLLYVGMTRAMEKLYLTGCETADYRNNISKKCAALTTDSVRLPFSLRCSRSGYMFWIECCYTRIHMFKDASEYIVRQEYGYDELERLIQRTMVAKAVDFETLVKEAEFGYTEAELDKVKKNLDFAYLYEALTRVKNKYSISEIKKLQAYDVYEEPSGDINDIINDTKKDNTKDRKITASERGTLIHKFMELLDFAGLKEGLDTNGYFGDIKKYLAELIAENIYSVDESMVIPLRKIAAFLTDSLGQRMIRAAKRGELFREKAFTKAFPVTDFVPDFTPDMQTLSETGDDMVIVQGIIDAYFYEDGKAVLVDYKTDRKTPEQLVGMYHAQLEYYAKTIESLLDRNVQERLIYSFHNDCVVEI